MRKINSYRINILKKIEIRVYLRAIFRCSFDLISIFMNSPHTQGPIQGGGDSSIYKIWFFYRSWFLITSLIKIKNKNYPDHPLNNERHSQQIKSIIMRFTVYIIIRYLLFLQINSIIMRFIVYIKIRHLLFYNKAGWLT